MKNKNYDKLNRVMQGKAGLLNILKLKEK